MDVRHEEHWLVGPVKLFAATDVVTATVQDKEVAIFALEDGRYLAVENRCPHQGGRLAEGIRAGHHVYCPLHNRKIDLENGHVESPHDGCIQTFTVKIEDNQLYILFPNAEL